MPIFATAPTSLVFIIIQKSIEEATNMVKEAIELYLESLKDHNEEITNDEGTLEYTLTVEISA